jgi:hypothetical protein
MRFLKKKAPQLQGQAQGESSDAPALAAADSKPLQSSAIPSSDTGADPLLPQPNASHKKKKVTGGLASIADKKSKVDSLLSISSTASFAFDERKMWHVDPNDLTALKKHAGKTDHCNICGHSGCDAICGSCGSQFHTACVTNDTSAESLGTFKCQTCKTNDAEQTSKSGGSGSGSSVMKPCARLGQDDWRPKDDPRPCVSCGYADAEFERCVQCKRDMCFACATLSQDTVPKRWRCPDCVGIEAYDDFVQKSVTKIIKNIGSCNLAHQSIDRFSQLVFDLMCSCAWSIHHDALPALLTLARRQLHQMQLPAIMPFHSLHYCIHPCAVSAIAQVGAFSALFLVFANT